MRTAILIIMVCVASYSALSQTKQNKKMETIILVHGAWSDASAWDGVVPSLKAQGAEVIVVNLPGHGKDGTSFANISLQSYVDLVKKAIGNHNNVTLVGHSMAGIVISQVAEAIPLQIKELIYLAAFLPQNGESLLSLAKLDADSHIGKYLQVDESHGTAVIAKEGVIDVFAEDAPKAIADYLVANTKAEPLAPLATPVNLTPQYFGTVKKIYIYTENDHAVSYKLQQLMTRNTPVTKTYALASSHTPFISKATEVAEIIGKEAK